MKKLVVLLAVIALVSCLGSFVFAAETEAPTTVEEITTETITTTEEANTDTTESVAEWVVNGIVDNLDKILAGVAGIISMIVLIIQKVSILPKQDAFVTNTSNTFSAFVSDINTFRGDMKSNADNMKTDVANSLNTINSVIDKVEEMKREQLAASADKKHFKEALVNVADMLNTIIQASTLSQRKKDEVDEMHKAAVSAANAITEDGDAA